MEFVDKDKPLAILCGEKDIDPYCLDMFRIIVENVDEIMVVLDENLRIKFVNSAAERILGYPSRELVGHPYRHLFTDRSWNIIKDLIRNRFMKKRQGRKDDTITINRFDMIGHGGSEIKCEFTSTPIYSENDYMGAVLVIRDISSRLKIEEELLKRDEMLHIINKIMRHDIRNRLSIAYGFLGLIRETNRLDEMMITKSYNAVGKAIGITKRMSDLESITLNGVEEEPVSIARICKEISPDIEMDLHVEGNCKVKADNALVSVFENLISNAQVHGNADRVEIDLRECDGNCIVDFRDNGKGMPDRYLSQIFEEGISFGSGKGSGLGLFIVKRTIERYGGTISARNLESGGLGFKIIIPLWCEKDP